jgi:signal transduction histidine kinase
MVTMAPEILAYVYILIGLIAVIQGVFIVGYGLRLPCNQAFFTFSVGTGLWVGGFGLFILTREFLFIDILNTGGLLLVIGITWFAYSFPQKQPYPLHASLFWGPLFIGGTILILRGEIISHVEFTSQGTQIVTHGNDITVWGLLLVTYTFLCVRRLILNYYESNNIDRARLFLIYFGIIIFLLSSALFDVLLPGIFSFTSLNFLGPASALIFLSVVSYALLKKNFLNARVIIQRGLVYSASFTFLTASYILFLIVLDLVLLGMTNIAAPIGAGLTILVGIYTLPRIEIYFRRITDPLFFKDGYDYFGTLEELTRILNENLDLKILAVESLKVLNRTFKPKYIYFTRLNSLERYFPDDTINSTGDKDIPKDAISIALKFNQHHSSTFVIGKRKSGDAYSREDILFLHTFANNAAIAFEKAELHQKLQEYSTNLETKVAERTFHLKQLQESQRVFFNDISHALQTPLTVLSSGVERLKTQSFNNQHLYNAIEQANSDISRLIRSILKLARVDAQVPGDEMNILDLAHLIRKLVEYVSVIAEAHDITVQTECDFSCFINGNEDQLEEVFTNILSNAVKYTEGCPARELFIKISQGLEMHTVSITDTGIGMTAEQAKMVFERYYRTNTSQNREGYGLGLAITKRIVEKHNGVIAIESQLGKGTRVLVSIPAAKSAGTHS